MTYCDPPSMKTCPAVTFEQMWSGKALLLSRDPLIPEEEIIVPRPGLGLRFWVPAATLFLLGAGGLAMYWRRHIESS